MKTTIRNTRLVLLLGAAAAAAAVAACSGDAISKLVGIPAHLVYITPGTPQPAAQGDTVYFAIVNEGAVEAFFPACGDGPALDVQKRVNGQWVAQAAATCPAQTVPGPIGLAVGVQIVVSRLFVDPGTYRVGISVSTSSALADAQEAYTVSFNIP